MSKDLFMMMREEEVATSNFLPSKKEIQNSSKEFAKKIIDNGEHNLKEVYAQSIRLKEAINTIEAFLKSNLPDEDFEEFGLKGQYRSGGNTINYKEDEKYLELQNQLKHRESLLKAALGSDIEFYDEEGVKVPKVSTTPRKSSLAISF